MSKAKQSSPSKRKRGRPAKAKPLTKARGGRGK